MISHHLVTWSISGNKTRSDWLRSHALFWSQMHPLYIDSFVWVDLVFTCTSICCYALLSCIIPYCYINNYVRLILSNEFIPHTCIYYNHPLRWFWRFCFSIRLQFVGVYAKYVKSEAMTGKKNPNKATLFQAKNVERFTISVVKYHIIQYLYIYIGVTIYM